MAVAFFDQITTAAKRSRRHPLNWNEVEEEVLGKQRWRLMRRLMGYMRPHGALWPVAGVSAGAIGAAGAGAAADQDRGRHLSAARSGAYAHAARRFSSADPYAGLARIGLMYLGMLAAAFVCEFGQTYLMQYTASLPCSTCARS